MRIICGATAYQCMCIKNRNHVEVGDPLHECGRNCTGAWVGNSDDDSFVVMRWPGVKDLNEDPQKGFE